MVHRKRHSLVRAHLAEDDRCNIGTRTDILDSSASVTRTKWFQHRYGIPTWEGAGSIMFSPETSLLTPNNHPRAPSNNVAVDRVQRSNGVGRANRGARQQSNNESKTRSQGRATAFLVSLTVAVPSSPHGQAGCDIESPVSTWKGTVRSARGTLLRLFSSQLIGPKVFGALPLLHVRARRVIEG